MFAHHVTEGEGLPGAERVADADLDLIAALSDQVARDALIALGPAGWSRSPLRAMLASAGDRLGAAGRQVPLAVTRALERFEATGQIMAETFGPPHPWTAQGPMSAIEFRLCLRLVGLDLKSICRLAYDRRTAHGWWRGRAPIPTDVASTLRDLVRRGATFGSLETVLLEMARDTDRAATLRAGAAVRPLSVTTLLASRDDPRPWFDVRPRDCTSEDAAYGRFLVFATLEKVLSEGLRLRLILNEADDLIDPDSDPLEPLDYAVGDHRLISSADEIVIETRSGKRYLCAGRNGCERGWM